MPKAWPCHENVRGLRSQDSFLRVALWAFDPGAKGLCFDITSVGKISLGNFRICSFKFHFTAEKTTILRSGIQ